MITRLSFRMGRRSFRGRLVPGTGELLFWDVKTGKILHTHTDHKFAISSVAVSPDGKFVATGGGYGEVRSGIQPVKCCTRSVDRRVCLFDPLLARWQMAGSHRRQSHPSQYPHVRGSAENRERDGEYPGRSHIPWRRG